MLEVLGLSPLSTHGVCISQDDVAVLALLPLLDAGAGAIAQLPFHGVVVQAPSWRAGDKSLYDVLNCESL